MFNALTKLHPPRQLGLWIQPDTWVSCLYQGKQAIACHAGLQLDWPIPAEGTSIHVAICDSMVKMGKLRAATRNHLSFLPAQARLAASEAWQCPPDKLRCDHAWSGNMQIAWLAIRASTAKRVCDRETAAQHVRILEPAGHAVARALRHLLPKHHPHRLLVIEPHRDRYILRLVTLRPFACTLMGVVTLQTIVQLCHDHPGRYQPVWTDPAQMMPDTQSDTSRWQTVAEALAPSHHPPWLQLPPWSQGTINQPSADQRICAFNHVLAAYGAALRKHTYGD